jgi:hypothetical protein
MNKYQSLVAVALITFCVASGAVAKDVEYCYAQSRSRADTNVMVGNDGKPAPCFEPNQAADKTNGCYLSSPADQVKYGCKVIPACIVVDKGTCRKMGGKLVTP